MQGSIGFDPLAGRYAARIRAREVRRAKQVAVRADRHPDPFDPLFTPLTIATTAKMILLGLGMALLPVLLPFVAGGHLLARKRRAPPVF